jgi:hypothetical protein
VKKNIGGVDRALRLTLGLGLLLFAFVAEKPNAYWGLLGIVPFVTGSMSFCPLYSIFGFSSCPASDIKSSKEKNVSAN